ncbi:hypothetical protein ACV8SN_20090 [Citrobacter portucalensis]
MKPTYEELELQLEESQREFRAADATIHNLELKITDMTVQLANAESKCRELAAENAGLKAICEDRRTFIMNGVQLGYIKVPTVDTDPALDTIRVAVSPQAPTPATDAFLAEVRAQGVDIAIAELKQLAHRSEKEAPIAAEHHRSAALYIQLLSSQLRQEPAQ